jgi:hypothetical protein
MDDPRSDDLIHRNRERLIARGTILPDQAALAKIVWPCSS